MRTRACPAPLRCRLWLRAEQAPRRAEGPRAERLAQVRLAPAPLVKARFGGLPARWRKPPGSRGRTRGSQASFRSRERTRASAQARDRCATACSRSRPGSLLSPLIAERKSRMPLPSVRPTSGSRFGPSTRRATTRTNSRCVGCRMSPTMPHGGYSLHGLGYEVPTARPRAHPLRRLSPAQRASGTRLLGLGKVRAVGSSSTDKSRRAAPLRPPRARL